MASLLGFGPKCCTACRRLRLYRGSEAMRDQGHNSCGSFLDVLLLGILEPCLDPQNHRIQMEVSRKNHPNQWVIFLHKTMPFERSWGMSFLDKISPCFVGGDDFFAQKVTAFPAQQTLEPSPKIFPSSIQLGCWALSVTWPRDHSNLRQKAVVYWFLNLLTGTPWWMWILYTKKCCLVDHCAISSVPRNSPPRTLQSKLPCINQILS